MEVPKDTDTEGCRRWRTGGGATRGGLGAEGGLRKASAEKGTSVSASRGRPLPKMGFGQVAGGWPKVALQR